MKKSILQWTLKNALDFQGKANANAVLGKVLAEHPELKKNIKEVLGEIAKTIKEVEKLSPAEIQKKLRQLNPQLLQEQPPQKEEQLKLLPNAQNGKVVVRIAPSPSGPLHIGHAYGVSINYEYAKMYHGKLILRLEDTNPENIYPPAYQMIEQDAQWLTDQGVAKIVTQSSRLGIYYDYGEKLVRSGNAYVCTCDADSWRELKKIKKACPCRNILVKENQLRYAKLFTEYAEGEAVVRLKTDMEHPNPAMRDIAIMRIVEHLHPKTGKEQRLWPLMVFAVAIDDHELGITHVLNGKDQADNALKERLIMECFDWKAPEYKHWGIINFQGFVISKTETKRAIEEGKYTGWDDIRLPFLPALRRRGYQPGAFRKFAREMGLSLNDKTVSMEEFWKTINAFNREIIEPQANRYFFIDQPKKITIDGAPQKKVELDLHPDFPKRGQRTIMVQKEIYLSKSDQENLSAGKIHRLMEYCNFTSNKQKYAFVSENYEEYKNAPARGLIMHWLPVQDDLPQVEVVMEDGSVMKGLGEKSLLTVPVGEIVQLERRYFARVDHKERNKITLWYLHK